MKKILFLCSMLLIISHAEAYTNSPLALPGHNQYGYDTNLRGWGIWNGTLNGTNFGVCGDGYYSRWNGSGFQCSIDQSGGGGGNHANLTNLSYTASGHTGFASSSYINSSSYIDYLESWFDIQYVIFSDFSIHSHDQGCSQSMPNFYDGLCIKSSDLDNDAGFINGSQFQANISYDLTALFPLNITAGATRTLTIQPNFTNVRTDTIKPNSTNTDYGFDLRNEILRMYHGALSYINVTSSKINITSPEININGSSKINITSPEININGTMNLNGKNIESELVKTSVKSFQADYLNSTQIYTDLIIIPQDVKLTNITSLIERSSNTSSHRLNFSIEKYTTYPTSKTIILNYSMTANQTDFDAINYNFNNKDIILLNYTTYQNVSKSSSMFKFVVR